MNTTIEPSEIISQCARCRFFEDYFHTNWPNREGLAMCADCVKTNGIVPLMLAYEPTKKERK